MGLQRNRNTNAWQRNANTVALTRSRKRVFWIYHRELISIAKIVHSDIMIDLLEFQIDLCQLKYRRTHSLTCDTYSVWDKKITLCMYKLLLYAENKQMENCRFSLFLLLTRRCRCCCYCYCCCQAGLSNVDIVRKLLFFQFLLWLIRMPCGFQWSN